MAGVVPAVQHQHSRESEVKPGKRTPDGMSCLILTSLDSFYATKGLAESTIQDPPDKVGLPPVWIQKYLSVP
jgi:hypothetical protein